MKTNLQTAALRYRSELIVPAGTEGEKVTPAMVAAFLRNVEALGFELSPEVIKQVMELAPSTFKDWAVEVIKVLKESKGANYRYEPMYPNFPKQVAEASDVELFVNAIMHYFGDLIGTRIMPVYEKEERFPFYEDVTLTTLRLAEDNIASTLFSNLLDAKVSYSEADSSLLEDLYLALSFDEFEAALDAAQIPNKENFAHLAKVVRGDKEYTEALLARAATPTDLLRVGAVYSGAHPSLKDKFRFGKMTRAERRTIVKNLARLDGKLLEDFNRNREMWKRFTERLHVGEFIASDSKLAEALTVLRSSKSIPTWGTRMEAALASNDYTQAAAVLSQRPGEFARRLNQLLTWAASDEVEYILAEFEKVADKVSTTVLLQVIAFFHTVQENPNREFSTLFTGGVKRGAFALPRQKSRLSGETCKAVVIIATEALKKIYGKRESLGKVFYDFDGSYNPVVPFGLRNTSTAFRVVGRGTRTQFNNTDKTLRFFVHWRDMNTGNGWDDRVDLDLSAVLMDEDFNSLGEIAYYNLRGEGAVHSGDITSAPEGASEFIDIDMKVFRKVHKNARYIAMTVHSYTQQKFSQLDECLAGFMTREEPQSGEVYEPSSVENAFTINTDAIVTIPMLFDLVEGVAIFTDVPGNGRGVVNNAANTHRNTKDILKGLVAKQPVTYDDVISANLAARAELVEDEVDADLVVRLRDGESSIGFDEFLAKWL